MLLEGKNAVIYGGGGSTGGAVARAFASKGAHVFIAGRSREPLDKVASEIEKPGGRVEVAELDALDGDRAERHPRESPALGRHSGELGGRFDRRMVGLDG